jgi:hypothetical protein
LEHLKKTANQRGAIMRKYSIVAALLLLWCFGVAAQSPSGGHVSQDIKGWRGAEWGMTPEQVGKVTGLRLGDPVTGENGPPAQCYDVANVPTGDWNAAVRFCFGQDGQQGLTLIEVRLGAQASYARIRDDLKNKYGAPVSEIHDVLPSGSILDQTKWLLPSTDMRCDQSRDGNGRRVSVWYARRTKTPF